MILSASSQSPRRPLRGCFAVLGLLTLAAGIRVNQDSVQESCTGCRRIRSKTASRGITRICAVTVFTHMYRRWANRTENLPFGSAGLLRIIQGAADRIKMTLCRSSMAMTSVLTSCQWGYPIQGLGSNLALCGLLPNIQKQDTVHPKILRHLFCERC